MKFRWPAKLALLVCVTPFLRATSSAEVPLPPATIVVYNSALPESAELAKFYAQKRGIAHDHLIALSCSKEEEISREEYDTTIAQPLSEIFRERKWWTIESGVDTGRVTASTVRFAALIKGMPLKIRAVADYPDINRAPARSRIATRPRSTRNFPLLRSFRARFPAHSPIHIFRAIVPSPSSTKPL